MNPGISAGFSVLSQAVFRRAGGLIYVFLLLSCGIRLLMFQPCFDRISICLIRSLIFYSFLKNKKCKFRIWCKPLSFKCVILHTYPIFYYCWRVNILLSYFSYNLEWQDNWKVCHWENEKAFAFDKNRFFFVLNTNEQSQPRWAKITWCITLHKK